MALPSFFSQLVPETQTHMLFGILLTAQVLICAVMGGLILIQRSEGGALGMGGGPSGFMSARGAGNLLTKLTWVFAALLFANSLGMTVVGNLDAHGTSIVDQADANKAPVTALATPLTSTATSAASSTSSAPSLNDLPLDSTPGRPSATTAPLNATPLGAAPAGLLPQAPATAASHSAASHSAASSASAVSASAAAPKMPKPLAPAATHLPSALGTTSVSAPPLGTASSSTGLTLGAKTSHSAAAPNIFTTSSSSTPKPVVTPVSPSSSAPASAPASSPASSQ